MQGLKDKVVVVTGGGGGIGSATCDRFGAEGAHVVVADIKAEDFDVLFYPGGHGPLEDLAEDRTSEVGGDLCRPDGLPR